jgi:hypothetical protein
MKNLWFYHATFASKARLQRNCCKLTFDQREVALTRETYAKNKSKIKYQRSKNNKEDYLLTLGAAFGG